MIDRLLIVRLGSLGDLVHTLPAADALRRAHPAAEIDWLVDAPHRDFLGLVPILSRLVVLERRGVSGWLAVRHELRARRYDVAVDFQGLIKSAALARLSGAPRVIGFDRQSLREPAASMFYTERVDVGEGRHVIRKNLRLAAALGGDESSLAFPIGPVASTAASEFVAGLPAPYALLNPGAAWPNKRWPADRLGAVARAILDRHGLSSVVLWGPGEQAAAEAAAEASGGAARPAPPTGLRDLIALGRGARLMVSGDTGPLHITSALGVPAVALFGPTDPARNGPWDPNDVVISKYPECACHYVRSCRRSPADWCLGGISVEQVVAAVDERLRRAGNAATRSS